MKARISRLGNNDCIILPKEFLEEASLSSGDIVDIKCNNGNLVITKTNKKRRPLSEILGDWYAPDDYKLEEFLR